MTDLRVITNTHVFGGNLKIWNFSIFRADIHEPKFAPKTAADP